jgi:hypothetical protein
MVFTSQVIKLRKPKWVGHMRLMREKRNSYLVVIQKFENKKKNIGM